MDSRTARTPSASRPYGSRRKWSLYSRVTGITFLLMFIVTGVAQVQGLVNYAGLFQRITLTIGWVWLTLLPISLLKAPRS